MRKSLYSLLLLSATINLYAQKISGDSLQPPYSSAQKKYTFAIQPMQWFNWAWRFDFGMSLGDGSGWLQFGPAVYSFKENIDNPHYYYDGTEYRYSSGRFGTEYRYSSGRFWNTNIIFRDPFSKLRGGGLDINYKRFIDTEQSCYFAAGLSYTHFKIDYWGYGWKDYTEDGLLYHAYVLDYRTQHINRLGINTYLGYQIPTYNAFLFDIFGGLAYRHSFLDKDKPAFNRNRISYGYTGFVYLVGMRIGFKLR